MTYFLPMHRVAFFVYAGFELLDMAGPVSVFDGCNHMLVRQGKKPHYQIELLSAEGGPVASSSSVLVETRQTDKICLPFGTLLVVGSYRDALLRAASDPKVAESVTRLVGKASRIGSICSGAYILAALKLIDGRNVTTHWEAHSALATNFPTLNVQTNALYVEDDPVWTSAGVTTGIDMALAMIARDLNTAISAEVAKHLVIYAQRTGDQPQFSPLLKAQLAAESPFSDLIAWIHANLEAAMDVPTLAARAGLGERTFYRKFLATIGQTPAQFVETARLDAARMLLTRGVSPKVAANRVGIVPTKRFVEAFERRFNVTPRQFEENCRMETEGPSRSARKL